ncbi:MAG: cytochrome c3 family protein [Myxococcales bacterium]|jgi:c(7)-type cytochrome triheme protein
MSATKRTTSWGCAMAGCLALAVPAVAEGPVRFSHETHIDSADLECAACHRSKPEGMELRTKVCSTCHDDGAPAWKLEPKAKRLKATFSHEAHASAGDCLDCHRAVLTSENTQGKPMARVGDCDACHAKAEAKVVESNCHKCHATDARKMVPDDHRAGWLARHGAESQDRVFDEHGRDCKACHGQNACVRCHRSERPKSHTGLWRVRLHGKEASWDRESCKTCHETSTCTQCHRSTRPMNHNASWRAMHGLAASGSGESCTVCHRASQCAACHRSEGK